MKNVKNMELADGERNVEAVGGFISDPTKTCHWNRNFLVRKRSSKTLSNT